MEKKDRPTRKFMTRLTEANYEFLKQTAADSGYNMTELINIALENFIAMERKHD